MVADQRPAVAQDMSTFAGSVGKIATDQLLRHAKRRPALEILLAAKTEQVNLIVVGTTGKSGLLKFFLGSVAEEVLRDAICDVLAVPHKEIAEKSTDV